MNSVHVDCVAASSNISSIASAIGRTVCISPDAVDVGEGSATEMLGRLGACVASFPATLQAQLTLAATAFADVVADAHTADTSVTFAV